MFSHLARLLAVPLLLAAGAGAARGQAPQRTLWVDPVGIDLTDREAREYVLNQPVQRLVITAFLDAQTVFPTRSALFAQMPRYKGKPDVLAAMLALARRDGKSCYLALNCLRWGRPGSSVTGTVFARHPALAARDAQGGFGRPGDGRFASPFNPKVREELLALIEELAERYPSLDGLVLDYRLPAGAVLGYSAVARERYCIATGIDPINVPLNKGPAGEEQVRAWSDWRVQECTGFLRQLSDAFTTRRPSGKVAAVGIANYYRSDPARHLAVPMDWLNWTSPESAHEVFLVAAWDEPANKDLLLHCKELISDTTKPTRLSAVLRPGDASRVAAEFRPLLAQKVQGVVFLLERPEQREEVGHALRDTLPALEHSPLEMELLYLEADLRLEAGVTADLQEPKIDELLDLLRRATGLRLPRDDSVDLKKPVTGSLSMRHMMAWELMDLLARSKAVRGRWFRIGDDYRLVGGAGPPAEEPAPPGPARPSALRYWLTGVGVAILAGTSAWLGWRRLRMRPR